MIPDHWFYAGMGTPTRPSRGGSRPFFQGLASTLESPEELIVLLLVCEGPQPGVGGGVLEKMHPRDGSERCLGTDKIETKDIFKGWCVEKKMERNTQMEQKHENAWRERRKRRMQRGIDANMQRNVDTN